MIAIFIFVVSVSANSGPVIYTGDQNSVLVPKENTNVSILHETLEYNIYGTGDNDKYADVHVRYVMENTGAEEKLTAIFPRWVNDDADIFAIYFNGDLVESEFILIGGDDASFEHVIERINELEETPEEVVCQNEYTLYGCVAANVFEITVPEDGVHELVVEYKEQPTEIQTNPYGSKISYEGVFTYYLEPASYWKSFGELDISISIPKELKVEGLGNFDVSKEKGRKLYQIEYNELPNEDLVFTVYKQSYKSIITLVTTIIIFGYIGFRLYINYRKINSKAIKILDQIFNWILRVSGLIVVMGVSRNEIISYSVIGILFAYLIYAKYFTKRTVIFVVLDTVLKIAGILVIYILIYTYV